MTSINTKQLTSQERCERFVKLFAETEETIKRLLPRDERRGDFQDLAFRYSLIRPGLKELSDSRRLKSVAEILKRVRDLLAHTGWSNPSVIPSEEVLQTLESLHAAVTNPETAQERFVEGKQPVVFVEPQWPVSGVLKIVHAMEFSQFPIVEGEAFKGILTEQSIARFIARRVAIGVSEVNLDDLKVSDIQQTEAVRDSYRFVRSLDPVDDIEQVFHTAVELEAIFITESGLPTLPVLGIATTWDIARLHSKRKSIRKPMQDADATNLTAS